MQKTKNELSRRRKGKEGREAEGGRGGGNRERGAKVSKGVEKNR